MYSFKTTMLANNCSRTLTGVHKYVHVNYWAWIVFKLLAPSAFVLILVSESRREAESMLLVLWRLGARCNLHRKEPAWEVGEHRQLLFVALDCLWSPEVNFVPPLDILSVSDGISTFMTLLNICPLSMLLGPATWDLSQCHMNIRR